MSRKKELWSYATRRPCRVRAFERTPGGPLWLRWWDPDAQTTRWQSLDHRDRIKAEAEADAMRAKIRSGEKAMAEGKTILAQLFLAYEKAVTARKSKTEQKADTRRVEMWTRILGAEKVVDEITLEEWQSFIDRRTSGEIDSRGRTVEARVAALEKRRNESQATGRGLKGPGPNPEPTPVRARTVEADCKWLRLVIGWGTRHRPKGPSGPPLVIQNVLVLEDYVKAVPKEKNPRRPVASTDRLEALRAVAGQVSDLAEFLEVMAGTGRRLSAVRRLRWEDVILERASSAPHGAIRWRAETDKMGKESTVPMSPRVRAAIDQIRQKRPGVGRAWLFPAPENPDRPVSRGVADHWLRRAEKLAELEPQDGSLWHAFRRGWATARKHLPVVDVAKAGGWATVEIVQGIYQQADAETILNVVLNPAEIREVSKS